MSRIFRRAVSLSLAAQLTTAPLFAAVVRAPAAMTLPELSPAIGILSDARVDALIKVAPELKAPIQNAAPATLEALRAALKPFRSVKDIRAASNGQIRTIMGGVFGEGKMGGQGVEVEFDFDENDELYFKGSGAPPEDSSKSDASKPKAPRFGYLRSAIAAARFGSDKRAALLKKAYTLTERIGRRVIGQEEAATALQNRVVSYLESFGTRKQEPLALHLVGLTGVGKSAMLDELEAIGIKVLRFDAQRYADGKKNLSDDIKEAVEDVQKEGVPYVIAVQEIDKLAEVQNGEQKTVAAIGALNQLLDSGVVGDPAHPRKTVNVSNALIVTTMNFAPKEVENFSKEVLKKKKSFFDFNDKDFLKLDAWMRRGDSPRYKVLSRLFRDNTVGRLAPNLVILNSLRRTSYLKIAQRFIDSAIEHATKGTNEDKQLTVDYTPRYKSFVAKRTGFIASGARETVARADMMTEQLIHYASRATVPGDRSLDQPRRILLDMDLKSGNAVLTVTPRLLTGKDWHDGASFMFHVKFNADSGEFIQPEGLALDAPARKIEKSKVKARILVKDILAARFPKMTAVVKGLADAVSKIIIGQKEAALILERELTAYMGRPGPAVKEPSQVVFAGFPGIGKSGLVEEAAKHLKLPIIRLNMESYASDESESVKNFLDAIDDQLEDIEIERGENWDGKYILLLEELDKVSEIEDGKLVRRPVMSAVKDILNNGQARLSTVNDNEPTTRFVDVRPAFLVVTMNFPIDVFGFRADPRWTSIKNMIETWKNLRKTLSDLKDLLQMLFRPETVNRLLSSLHILRPLTKEDYEKVIALQERTTREERLLDEDKKNPSLIELKTTPAYRRYLFAETVVPSEGPRHTSKMSRSKINGDLEQAIRSLKRSAPYASKPVTIVLDYTPGRQEVVARLEATGLPTEVLYRRKVALFFPPLGVRGRMKEKRVQTAIHEFGHAYSAVRLGTRIEYATVVPPSGGIGGYVQPRRGPHSAKNGMAGIYMSLASRAFERIFQSADPLAPESVMDVSKGPSVDIQMATEELVEMLYQLGFNPDGGTIDRTGGLGPHKYINFADIPAATAEKLGLILRDMENYLVSDMLKANSRDWYIEKITEFARKGGVEEKEFYKILGYRHPGKKDEKESLGEVSLIRDSFAHALLPVSAPIRNARAFRQGQTQTTAAQNMDAYYGKFLEILKKRLGATPTP